MPVAAALAPIAGSVIGAVAGGTNKRPPSLTPQQSSALNSDLSAATTSATGPVRIDPNQQAAIYDQIARSTTGANDTATHALASRGLGRSGILASAIENNSAQQSANQTGANLSLEQQALQNQQFNRGLVSQLTTPRSVPGQSTAGAVSAGIAAPLTYAAQQYANNNPSPTWQNIPFQNSNVGLTTDSTGRSSADLGNFS